MKNRHRIRFAVDNMLIHKGQMRAGILLYIITLLLFSFILAINNTSGSLREELEDCFFVKTDTVGGISFDAENYDRDNINKYINMLSEQDYIDTMGSWVTSPIKWQELCDMQNSRKKRIGELENGYAESIYMSIGTWDLFNFQLINGYIPKEAYKKLTCSKRDNLIYLGYGCRDIADIGDIIRLEGSNMDYLVAGFLERGQTMPIDELVYMGKFDLYATTPLDYEAIIVQNEMISGWSIFFSIDDDYSFDDVRYRLQLIGDYSNVDVTVYNIGEITLEAEQYMTPIKKYLWQLFYIIGVTACIVLACFQVINVLTRKSDYGILYSCGLDTGDLLYIVLFENAIKILIALMIEIPSFIYAVNCIIGNIESAEYNIIKTVLFNNVVAYTVIVGIILTVLSSIIPIILLSRYKPVELMEEK